MTFNIKIKIAQKLYKNKCNCQKKKEKERTRWSLTNIAPFNSHHASCWWMTKTTKLSAWKSLIGKCFYFVPKAILLHKFIYCLIFVVADSTAAHFVINLWYVVEKWKFYLFYFFQGDFIDQSISLCFEKKLFVILNPVENLPFLILNIIMKYVGLCTERS